MSQMIKLRVTVASGRVFKIPLKSDGSVGDLREVVKRRSLVGVDDKFDLCSEGDVLCDEDKVLDIVENCQVEIVLLTPPSQSPADAGSSGQGKKRAPPPKAVRKAKSPRTSVSVGAPHCEEEEAASADGSDSEFEGGEESEEDEETSKRSKRVLPNKLVFAVDKTGECCSSFIEAIKKRLESARCTSREFNNRMRARRARQSHASSSSISTPAPEDPRLASGSSSTAPKPPNDRG